MTTEEAPQGKKKKAPPANLVIPPPKPKLTKAERRALQEQQRAAKLAAQEGGGGKQQAKKDGKQKQQQQQQGGSANQKQQVASSTPAATAKTTATDASQQQNDSPGDRQQQSKGLFSHLKPHQPAAVTFGTHVGPEFTVPSGSSNTTKIHVLQCQAVLKLGYQYATGEIRGGNARCRAMLECYRLVLREIQPQLEMLQQSEPAVDLRHVLDHDIFKPAFHYWTDTCRPHCVSMGNGQSMLKAAVASLPRDLDAQKLVATIEETIQEYVTQRIEYADRVIAELTCQTLLSSSRNRCKKNNKQRDSQLVVLTYGFSQVVEQVLLQAADSLRKDAGDKDDACHFRVIVVDSRPLREGRRLLDSLTRHGISCTYVHLNALSYVLQDSVSKVLLGASALYSDGSVVSRAGTATVALSAHALRIPVLVCSETYKISHRVQLESITQNELGNPKYDKKMEENVHCLNLLYDLTPASFVSGIVTELGIVPPSSVAVLLREMMLNK